MKNWDHRGWIYWSRPRIDITSLDASEVAPSLINIRFQWHMQMTFMKLCAMWIWICRCCMCAEVLSVLHGRHGPIGPHRNQRRWFLKASTGRSWWTPLAENRGSWVRVVFRGLHRQQTRMLEQTMGIYGNIRYISNQNGIYIRYIPT